MPTATQLEERERRVYKDAHAAQFAKIRHFPALSQVTSSGDNVILLQDSKQMDPIFAERQTRMDRIQSRIGAPDAFDALLGTKSQLREFRSAVLCKHTNAAAAAAQSNNDKSPPKEKTLGQPPRPTFKIGNANEAKSRVARPLEYDYPTGVHSRHERVISPAQRAQVEEANVLRMKPKWSATHATTAKKAIQVEYYMNSPMDASLPLDRKFIKEIVRLNVMATPSASSSTPRR
ncbi:hypothetical protein AC1031_006125 [Aphanomyces cochlioides]|nr:hypothetical protein AC1031_006125 [Aphanomyces cochlioides]